ncbi:MAG TPA: GTPase Era [Clostridiaceae bacterium]|nr:GTPase Era [Clostridiaceae bacterium]
MDFKSGFIAVIGRPNVGKSTLINRISGEKISIISDKPQTTRNVIKAIVTGEDYQMIFLDTPGIMLNPKNKLGEYMIKVATDTLDEVDIVLFIVEATGGGPGKGDLEILRKLSKVSSPVFLIINKIDLISKEQIPLLVSEYNKHMDFACVIPISAINGEGVNDLIENIKAKLPVGPEYFPRDMITDQPEKVIIAEIIREKTLLLLKEEVPHGIGVEILSFKEREDKNIIDIQANIYCERESHKGIVIGKNGKMLKQIGSMAREDMERFLGVKVFLELWVKVKKDWRNNQHMLNILGYKT